MASSIARQEGVTRLFKGTECAVARQALCGGIGVGLYQPVRTVITGGSDSSTFLQKVAAASLTGTIGQLAAAPLDVIKVRLQADGRLELLGETPRYRGMGHAMVAIPREEGFAALYKGLTPSLGRAAIMYGTSCATYDQAKTTVVAMPGSTLRSDALATHMLCSGMSGLVAALVSCPFDVIKTRCVLRVGGWGWGKVVGYSALSHTHAHSCVHSHSLFHSHSLSFTRSLYHSLPHPRARAHTSISRVPIQTGS